ncbi:hypothetical protein LAZ67_6003708 [Cordylochernes scorpioides]|uniref:RNA-directed DNA polymerase n=1 Tax=Cordylochernes scorpioides TaxID=51811 RepID=A0ABY6KL76_9ARAC|nr:hypothetical protein LAZ67_6003708 [Cordylochernes scorpioides]
MEEMNKKRRRAVRGIFTKTVNELKAEFKKSSIDKENIYAKYNRLESLHIELVALNEQCQLVLLAQENIADEEIDREYEDCEKYIQERFNMEQKIGILRNRAKDEVLSNSSKNTKLNIKLPELELKTYDGSLENWLPWWAQFSKVHENEDLSNSDKFLYLRKAILPVSEAYRVIASYPVTGDNYTSVIQALQERFGDPNILTELYVRRLLNWVMANVRKENGNLSNLYDDLTSHLRSLQTLGIDPQLSGIFLYPLVESSLPSDVLKIWQRHPSSGYGQERFKTEDPVAKTREIPERLKALMDFLRAEVKSAQRLKFIERGFNLEVPQRKFYNENPRKWNNSRPTTVSETFDFSTPNEWPKWRKRFERYLVVSGMKKKEEADKIDLFMYLMGNRTDDIFRTFKFEKEEEATKIDSVLKAFDSHFCVKKNIIYERAKFNSRIQEDREPVDEFITSLYKLADSCEFEGLHEHLIRDRIVVGVRDKALSERMQLDSELTLEKAVKMVRQQEAVRQQQVDLQRPTTSQKVNQVKFNSKKQSPKQQQQPSRKKEKSAKIRSRCPKSGGFTHREGQACRAEGQRCNLCSKNGHFANCCPDKQTKTAEVKAVSELDEKIGECRRRWTAEIQVNGKQVKFKLDSQADVTYVPLCLLKKIMGKQRLVESDINIRAAEFSELQTVGMFISTLRNVNYEIKEKIYVIRRLSEPLLSRRACELLNLARRIEVVATRINPIKEFPEVFEGLGQIGNPYGIKLKPGAKPYAVHTPRRVPIPLMEKLKTRLDIPGKDRSTPMHYPDNHFLQPREALLSYWHVKDELGVQIGLLMRSCRLVIPASMKLEILDKLHAGHFGITKTRLRARETVWWPGISEEIAETVRKCSVCIQEAVSKHEPLIPTNFPTRPWQKIEMDLFKFENKWYLVIIDYYSRFPEMIQLDRLKANVVVRSCKSIFARHGIPETVVSDNGTQFGAAREFPNFARQYGFTHVTSSPRFPQSNGMAEAGVKIAKLILTKNQDPSLGLLEYRSTPLENGYSPAELLMGRKLRTTLPIAPENLNPRLVDSYTLKIKEGRRRKDMKSRYDRRCGATDMEELSEGDTVWITDMRIWGIVKQKASTPRSYMVDTPVGTLRRNRFHLRKGDTVQYPAGPSTPTFSGEELVENEKTPVVDYPSNDSEDGQIRTRKRDRTCTGPHFQIMCRGTSHGQGNLNWRSDNRSHNSSAEQNEGKDDPVTAMANQVCTNSISLMTLIVKIKGPKRSKMVRVLLDSGSQKSYIRRSLAKELDLPKLDNVDEGKAFKMEALEETIICGDISPVEAGPRQWELDERGITLTGVDNNKTEIDILIGGDYYGKLLTGKVEQLAGGLTAIQTVLEWTLIGNASSERPETSAQMVLTLHTTQQGVAS